MREISILLSRPTKDEVTWRRRWILLVGKFPRNTESERLTESQRLSRGGFPRPGRRRPREDGVAVGDVQDLVGARPRRGVPHQLLHFQNRLRRGVGDREDRGRRAAAGVPNILG